MTVVGLGTFVLACTCATLGLMISLSFLVFHIYHRQNKLVKMSSPYMNMVTSVGAIGLSVVCFLYGLDFVLDRKHRALTALCQVRLWVLVTSVTLMLGPVCTKAWRVYSIFRYAFAKKVVIRDRKLVGITAGFLLVDVVLMSLWQTIDPVLSNVKVVLEAVVENESATYFLNGTGLIRGCTCSKIPIWIAVLALWKVLLLVTCLVFAWKTRNVSVPALNDVMYVFAGTFTVIVIALCAAVISIPLQKSTDAVYCIICIAISASAIAFQMILFLPRVHYWWTTPDDASPRISSASARELTSAEIPRFPLQDYNANTYENDGILEIVEENKTLKDSLLEKESLISKLQSHLDAAREKMTRLPTDIDFRHDSGYEVDNMSESHDDIYDTLRPPGQSPDRSVLYRVQETPRSARSDVTDNVTDIPEQCHQTEVKCVESQSVQSTGSRRSFVHEFTDIRNSIESELESASHINLNLKKSLSVEMERPSSETEWLYESNSTQDLAGSIAQSYNLGTERETEEYLQSFLPVENSLLQIRRTRRLSSASIRSMPSSENMSSRSVDNDSTCVGEELPTCLRGSGTPNSVQHAEILRYYSRRLNDGFKRYTTYRVNRDFRPSSFRFKRNSVLRKTPVANGSSKTPQNFPFRENPAAIYSVPNVVQKPPRTFQDGKWPPKDSFV